MGKFKILSLDGGGLRGVSSLTILQKLEEKVGRLLYEEYQLISGTSTGGLISCCLALGMKVGDILELYLKYADTIFPHHNGFIEHLMEVKNIAAPKYSPAGVEKVFNIVLGDKKMSDLKTDILIPSYDLNAGRPLFFKSRNTDKFDFKLYDICRATSAAPTYLPSYSFSGFDCIDGGIFCNNPSLASLAEILKHYDEYGLENNDINNISVMSVGTGHYQKTISKHDGEHSGELFWAKNAPDLMMSAVNDTIDYEIREILPDANYKRFCIEIKEAKYSTIDDSTPETLNYLIGETKKQIYSDRYFK